MPESDPGQDRVPSGSGSAVLSGEAGPGDQGISDMITVDLSDLQGVLDAAREGDEAAGDPLGDDAVIVALSDKGPRWSLAELAGAATEEIAPGPALGNWAACFAPGQMSDYALPGAAAACRRLASWAQAAELEIVAEVAARAAVRDSSVPTGPGGVPAAVPEEAAAEVALALRMSQYGASCWTQLAITLAGRLTGTSAALRAGAIDLSRARLIAEVTGVLDDRGAAAAEARVLPGAGTKTLAQLRAALRRAVIAVDPDAEERRREEAERRAKVGLYGDEDGTATLSGQNLPGAHAAAAMARVTALARALKSSGAGGGIDLLRAQVFLGLLLGTLPLVPPAEGAPPDPGGGDPGPPGDHDDPGDLGSGADSDPVDTDPDDPSPACPLDRDGPAESSGQGDGSGTGDHDDPDSSGGPGGHRDPGSGLGTKDPDDPGPAGPRDRDGPADQAGAADPGGSDNVRDFCFPDDLDDPSSPGDPGDPGVPGDPGDPDCPARDGTNLVTIPRWPRLPVPGQVPVGLARSGTGALAGLPRGPAGTGLLRLTVPWRTLARAWAGPGQLSRLGPVTPHTARRLAEAAAGDPETEWKVIVTDRCGQAIAITRLRRARARSPATTPAAGLVSQVTLIVPAGLARDQAGQQRQSAGPLSGTAPKGPLGKILAAALEAAALATARADAETAEAASLGTGGCAHRKSSPAYRPPPRLREFVTARDQTCRYPICRQPAHRADLDHTIPSDQGGRTCSCNLGGACRTHHRIKQRPGWQLTQPEPGTFVWITPAGRAYTQTPDTYLA